MLAYQLIDENLPILRLSDSVERAMDLMTEFRVKQLALVENNIYKGLIDEDILAESFVDVLADIQPNFHDFFAQEDQHLYELVALCRPNNSIDVLPVLNEQQQFLGTILAQHLLRSFAQQLNLEKIGSIIVIRVDKNGYSLAEIARLVETNNVKILSCFQTEENNEPTLTLKLNKADITAVVATLERFGYVIETTFANDILLTPESERLDMLFKYLSI